MYYLLNSIPGLLSILHRFQRKFETWWPRVNLRGVSRDFRKKAPLRRGFCCRGASLAKSPTKDLSDLGVA